MDVEIPEPFEMPTVVALFTGLGIAPLITVAAIIDGYSLPMIVLATVGTPVLFGMAGLWVGFVTWLMVRFTSL